MHVALHTAALAKEPANAAAGTAGNWALSPDGSEVIDVRAGQAWPRCVEGMQWTGKTCQGEPTLLTHKEALSLVSARRKADGRDWRLPRVTDLRRLVSETRASRGQYARLFPAAPADWYWASTANVDTASKEVNPYNYGNVMNARNGTGGANRMAFLHGWAVNMDTGEADGEVSRRSKLPVRLVRMESARR
ncbi:MAG: DUF1566 domain-containing protein [Aquabacterium sp.]